MERDVQYTISGRRGTEDKGEGKTINVSSCGILFTCQHQLAVGRRVRLCISWPVLLNDKVGLKLVVRGRVVRSEGGRAAIEIQQHEFRTQSASIPGESKSAADLLE
jgi:PilZ domain